MLHVIQILDEWRGCYVEFLKVLKDKLINVYTSRIEFLTFEQNISIRNLGLFRRVLLRILLCISVYTLEFVFVYCYIYFVYASYIDISLLDAQSRIFLNEVFKNIGLAIFFDF